MKQLKQEYEKLQAQFRTTYGYNGSCSCHINPPCGSCTHEGNPANLAECEDAWEEVEKSPDSISEHSLKLALAKELPELIGYDGNFFWRSNFNPPICVTPREWDWIMREVEKKLTVAQTNEYRELLLASHRPTDYQNGERHSGAISSPWQTRAITYFKTIGKEIK